MISVEHIPVSLSDAEWEAVQRVADLEAPDFAAGFEHGVEIQLITQPFFQRHRILTVQTLHPARGIHMALSEDGTATMLTARLPNFNAMVEQDPPPRIGNEGTARIYGNLCDAWTTESPLIEFPIGHFDDIPFVDHIHSAEKELMDDLKAELGDLILPLAVEQYDDGFVLVKWLVANQCLICRALQVTCGGEVARDDEVFDHMLPVPLGHRWAMKDGRLVPVD